MTDSQIPNRQRGLAALAKRACDIAAASAGLVTLAPVMAATAIAVRASMGSPVLFRQMRPGKDGKPFELMKFRTMRDATDASGQPLPDDERMTRAGELIRSLSLDELPQLLNVLRGDMSLVGPRPLLMRYLDRYTPHQARRHEVMPGLTGWTQVNGRNAIAWDQKFDLDVWYVDHWSLSLDAKIILMTLLRVAKRSGIAREGHATMPEFMGTKSER